MAVRNKIDNTLAYALRSIGVAVDQQDAGLIRKIVHFVEENENVSIKDIDDVVLKYQHEQQKSMG
jgi:RNase H-fold protein (predicted Holliday junction resolvase)